MNDLELARSRGGSLADDLRKLAVAFEYWPERIVLLDAADDLEVLHEALDAVLEVDDAQPSRVPVLRALREAAE